MVINEMDIGAAKKTYLFLSIIYTDCGSVHQLVIKLELFNLDLFESISGNMVDRYVFE